jgi:hypothetical protein
MMFGGMGISVNFTGVRCADAYHITVFYTMLQISFSCSFTPVAAVPANIEENEKY